MSSSASAVDTVSRVKGSASPDTKAAVLQFLVATKDPAIFGREASERLEVTEVSLGRMAEEPQRPECKVVCEVDVKKDMLNTTGFMHGGCSGYLVDICSTMAIVGYRMAVGGVDWNHSPDVSATIDMVYHSPALLGDKLRIVNTTLSVGSRITSARTEIWNVTRRRLVVSGVQTKAAPSPPKAKL